jgi:oligosaccharyltransferase complex subunit alpha (ribophorin I)
LYIRFPTENIVTLIGGEGKHAKNTIVYGPLDNVSPLSIKPCSFHYEYKDPIITITSLKREMEISHWGANLAIEEHYALRHDGAKYVRTSSCRLDCSFFFFKD